jgi:1-acyl-sn-glycerol-3-phosphate acyltransferase
MDTAYPAPRMDGPELSPEPSEIPSKPRGIEHHPGFWAWVGRTFLKLRGWTVEGGAPQIHKAVVIAAPHTSNWDFVYALAVALAYRMHLKWIGKHTLFSVPLWGAWLRFLGGIPIDRSAPQGMVKDAARKLREAESMYLMVPPEGTRSKTSGWKTGFYWIAVEAQVPILLGYLDYGRKCASPGKVFYPSGDIEKDFKEFRAYYQGVRGKYPVLQSEVRVQPKKN